MANSRPASASSDSAFASSSRSSPSSSRADTTYLGTQTSDARGPSRWIVEKEDEGFVQEFIVPVLSSDAERLANNAPSKQLYGIHTSGKPEKFRTVSVPITWGVDSKGVREHIQEEVIYSKKSSSKSK